MHIPDGFIDGPVSAAAGVVAAGGVGLCIRQVSHAMDERQVPLCGLAASYVFAVQMLNFPVASGTSGHLLGGTLAAILVGPWAGALCVAVVLLVQALVFADGGLTALGLNVVNMSLVGAFGGYAIFRLLSGALARLRSRGARGAVPLAAGIAAACAPVLASLVFVLELVLGGTVDLSWHRVLPAMVGVHVLIGIGEGLITAATVAAVLASRPDLVHGARTAVARTPEPVAVPA